MAKKDLGSDKAEFRFESGPSDGMRPVFLVNARQAAMSVLAKVVENVKFEYGLTYEVEFILRSESETSEEFGLRNFPERNES